MSKKKRASGSKPGSKQPAKVVPKKRGGNGRTLLTLGGAAVAVIALVVALMAGGKGGAQPSAGESKYVGRLLPAGYQEAKVAEPTIYTSEIKMSDVVSQDAGAQITIPLGDVTSKKNVYFEYRKAGAKPLPLLAYIKPSGKLFVGVSYCPPCEGERQTIAADGTLTCDSCGTKRNLETEAGLSGACRLYPLDEIPVTVSGGKVTIEKSVLDGWSAQPLDRQVG